MNSKHRRTRKYAAITMALFVLGFLLSSCSELNFGDMNTDPTAVTDLNPALLFTTTELSVSGTRYEVWRADMIQQENFVQHTVCTFFSGGNNYSINADWEHAFFQSAYAGGINGPNPAQIKNIQTVIHLLKKQKEDGKKVANKLAEARILRVYIFDRVTDLYGDIPYFDAGKAAWSDMLKPAYDSQEKIYADFFKELDEAVKQFDSSKPTFGDHDLIYQGNIAQWKKWANSLRLRLALRLIKVDLSTAKKQAKAALNADGGVMASNDDIAFIPQEIGGGNPPVSLSQNPIGETLESDHEFVAQTFIDWMKAHNDPRLAAYATKNGNGNYKGFPSGWLSGNVGDNPNFNPNYAGNFPDQGKLGQYSRVNMSLADFTDPFFLQTYAEVELMEARVNILFPNINWPNKENASIHYQDGVTAAMAYLKLFSNDGAQTNEIIPQSKITAYLNANPFKASSTKDQKLDQLNSQYWAAVFLNGWEAFANWRATGYPKLQPGEVDSPDAPTGSVTGKVIPRRLLYPEAQEKNLNKENYEAAIDRQGPNKMTTRVWWDVKK